MPNSLRIGGLVLGLMLIMGLSSACEKQKINQVQAEENRFQGIEKKPVIRTYTPIDPPLSYKFSFNKQDQELSLNIVLSFVMPADYVKLLLPFNEISLKVPNAQRRIMVNYLDRIADLRVNKGILTPDQKNPNIINLSAPRGEKIELSYIIKSSSENKDVKAEAFDTIILSKDYFNFLGEMALICPIPWQQFSKPREIKLEWDMPSDFIILNSFGLVNKPEQSLTTSLAELRKSVFIGGSKIRVLETQVRGRPVGIALNGTWHEISDQQWVDVIKRLLSTQREIWNDDNFPYFLVSLWAQGKSCTAGEGLKIKGQAYYNSFKSKYGPACSLGQPQILLMSHEMMHMWLGNKVTLGTGQGHDGRWLTEGFTDYFGRLLAYRAGLISLGDYFKNINDVLKDYQNSPVRNISLDELVKRYGNKEDPSYRDIFQVPYQQGDIMAMRLDQKIKENKGINYSLENVISDLLKIAQENPENKAHFTVEEVGTIVDKYAGAGVFAKEYEKVKNGALINPPKLGECAEPKALGHLMIYTHLNPTACKQWLNNQ